ncbi:hypothetical protein [Geomonas sp.]|uniref:hypothetical protein n=1 Tax=Geomonas sp. TaxID=2651584 RepID=UPI002B4A98B1|nr:hypothetical protein [Geomonas sp.]HJV36722.1 hypothetical protein [Geomonas sp.]
MPAKEFPSIAEGYEVAAPVAASPREVLALEKTCLDPDLYRLDSTGTGLLAGVLQAELTGSILADGPT